jgi:hypothetical protein
MVLQKADRRARHCPLGPHWVPSLVKELGLEGCWEACLGLKCKAKLEYKKITGELMSEVTYLGSVLGVSVSGSEGVAVIDGSTEG